jgi:hypothetical protein
MVEALGKSRRRTRPKFLSRCGDRLTAMPGAGDDIAIKGDRVVSRCSGNISCAIAFLV